MEDVSDTAIEQHIRTYRSILKQAGEVTISQLIDSHVSMHSLLHEHGEDSIIDTAAFIYSILRLPERISHIEHVLLGQSYTVFKKHGLAGIEEWKEISSPGRRRKIFYDGDKTIAVYIASVTDVDDMISLLTAYQIEWNKLHLELRERKETAIPVDDVERLKVIVGDKYNEFIEAIERHPLDFHVKLLSGSYVEYMRTTQMWWNNVRDRAKNLGIEERPIYFISSNTHSLVNVLSRTAIRFQKEMLEFLEQSNEHQLKSVWNDIASGKNPVHKEYFFHYLAKKYERVNPAFLEAKKRDEEELGLLSVEPNDYLDVRTQVIEMKHLAGKVLYEGGEPVSPSLQNSDAVIINIDYPLGWAAYQILSEVAQNVEYIAGVYIMGKSAILQGEIGDIVLPTEVFDEHSKNLIGFPNSITEEAIKRWYSHGRVFSNQKNITVKGTFFENRALITEWYEHGFTSIEMEAGPYLNAVSESIFYNRYHDHVSVHLPQIPFDFGMAYYASDTPNSKAKNLGSRNLSYDGVECTYGITMTILQRIIELETGKYYTS